MKHERRENVSGRYEATHPCDCCGKPAGNDFMTDAEVCGGSDGPGFYICERKRCAAKRDGKTVEERRAMYTAERARRS